MKQSSILIVDDDAISLRIIVDHLETNNYFTDTARSGEGAWEKLINNPRKFDIVIVDRLMEGMGGLELIRMMKGLPDLKDIPVIVQTGQAEAEEFIEALNMGAYDFVYKPVEQELLLFVVENALDAVPNAAFE